MRKTISYLKDFGLGKYLEKKVQKLAPGLHRQIYLGETGGVVRSVYGVLLHENWDDTTFRFCYFGTYAYGKRLSSYLASLDNAFVFLDIGANQGLYSLIAAKNPKCVQAIAFEPVAKTFSLLQKNIQANALEHRITPVNAAVSNQCGQARISIKAGHSGAASLRENDGQGQTITISLVDAPRIDELIPDAGDIIIKIDVEGHEDTVLKELTRSRHLPRVKAMFYEIDERWSDPIQIEATLRQYGFHQFRKMGTGRHYDILASR